MNKYMHHFKLRQLFILLLIAAGAFSCSEESYNNMVPPDWQDPNAVDTTAVDTTVVIDTVIVYDYITPQVDSEGSIIVDGRPPQYTDTATHHVIAVSTTVDLEEYYASAVGKSGEELRKALADIVTENFVPNTYGEARYVLEEADADPLGEGVWCFYEEKTGNATWDSGVTWNREHVWAKSKGLGGSISNNESGAASDLYNLKAENPTVNSNKSNRDFAEDEEDETYYGTHGTWSYAPMESARGDVARIMFYMELRWADQQGIVLDNYSIDGTDARHGELNDLIKWHSDDPVDPFEIRRSDIIYSEQDNRNPFVDHPELVDYLYGDLQNVAWDGGVTYKNN